MATVFVSHRSADTLAVERLASALRQHGHDVWLDVWQINVGDSIVERMNDGLSRSSYLIVCFSDAGSLAPWMGREWMSALARQLNGLPIRVLPVNSSFAVLV